MAPAHGVQVNFTEVSDAAAQLVIAYGPFGSAVTAALPHGPYAITSCADASETSVNLT